MDGKHTIFGTVAGNTVFNLLRMGEAEIGECDRPTEAIELKTVEVLDNPFDDVVPRDLAKGERGGGEGRGGAQGREEGGLREEPGPAELRRGAGGPGRRAGAQGPGRRARRGH